MTFVYAVAIRWVSGVADPSKMERVLDQFDDWFRYNQSMWLLATDHDIQTASDTIRRQMPAESVLLLQVATFTGYAPKMTWEWLTKYSDPINALGNVFGPRIHKS